MAPGSSCEGVKTPFDELGDESGGEGELGELGDRRLAAGAAAGAAGASMVD